MSRSSICASEILEVSRGVECRCERYPIGAVDRIIRRLCDQARKFGAGDITGKSAIGYFARLKKTTIKWNPEARVNWMS